MNTVLVFGDQLNAKIASLENATPDDTRILFVRDEGFINNRRFHRQRLHLVLAGMRRFAIELRDKGFDVDERTASSMAEGIQAHRKQYKPERVIAMETLSQGVAQTLDVELVPNNQMLCHYDEFNEWSGDAKRLRMEDFYRWQRNRLDVLIDGDQPSGGRWNFDSENRKPPPKQTRAWPEPVREKLDDVDREILASLPDSAFGDDPTGLWATDRKGALKRLRHFVHNVLPEFGPYEDAMLSDEANLNHSLLSHALNVGLLMPDEVVRAAETAYRKGDVPIESAEGFIRQIIGWREYIWNVYWRWMPDYRDLNSLEAKEPLPPMFHGEPTKMNCMSKTIAGVEENAWVHHIQRLMILGNFALTSGIEPKALVEWMRCSFIDGADWVMQPNVVGMALFADGGRMSTKPYASGGAYINKMSDYCKGCAYNPRKRTGDDACPFTTLYWDFLDRHRKKFASNYRLIQPIRNLERLSDIDEVRKRAREVKKLMASGDL